MQEINGLVKLKQFSVVICLSLTHTEMQEIYGLVKINQFLVVICLSL